MADKKRKNLLESSLFLTIVSLIVGFILRALALRYGGKETEQLAFIIGLVGVIATMQIGNLYRHREMADQLSEMKDALSEHNRQLARQQVLKESIAFLEPAIKDDRFLNTLSNIANSYKEIQRLKSEYENCKDFFEWKENLIFESMIPKLQQLAQRQIVIDKESKELTTNTDFLLKIPQRQVRAVSYQDGGFWDEPEGQNFLRAHVTSMSKDINISRIFILEEAEFTTQRNVIEAQVDMGIVVRVIDARKLKESEREDFVIYDDNYVRFAKLHEDTGTNTLKHATLVVGTDKVKDFIERYESLYARSMDASDFYTSLGFVKPAQYLLYPLGS